MLLDRTLCALLLGIVACHDEAPASQDTGPSGPGGPPPGPAGLLPGEFGDGPTTGSPTTGSGPASTTDETGTSTSTSSTGEAEATTVAPDLEDCGNGVLDPGEQCDLGFRDNNDHGSCTQACKTAFCGDGLVQDSHESCDLGPSNNDVAYGGCTQACQLGPRCNDGILQPEEECDATAPQLEGAVACDPANCRFKARVAFVTSAIFTGEIGGLAGADAACETAATKAGLDNAAAFQAWISDGEAAPATRLVKAAQDPLPYARRDGMQLAPTLAYLTTMGMQAPLDRTEYGVQLPAGQYAWTNVSPKGQPVSPTEQCQAWGSASFKHTARAGQISPEKPSDLPSWYTQVRWSSYVSSSCAYELHFYCFED